MPLAKYLQSGGGAVHTLQEAKENPVLKSFSLDSENDGWDSSETNPPVQTPGDPGIPTGQRAREKPSSQNCRYVHSARAAYIALPAKKLVIAIMNASTGQLDLF